MKLFQVSDGILLQEDLGVLPQSSINSKQLVQGKESRIPVIIATQMMEGMINSLTQLGLK